MEIRLCLALGALLAGLAAGGPGVADGPTAATAPEGWRADRGVLFRVVSRRHAPRGAAAPQPAFSLILGTLHFGSPEALGLDSPRLQERIGQMHGFIGEVDDREPWRPALQRYRLLDGAATLPGLIGARRFARLAERLPLPGAELPRLRPWVVLALLEGRGEIPTPVPLDEHLQRWAEQRGLRVRALETLEQQLAALDCVPPQEQALVLRQRLDRADDWRAAAERVLGYYRTGDLPTWFDEELASPGLDRQAAALEARARDCLLDSRNRRWLPRLAAELRQGGVFVAVGALHLTGPAGLLEGLRRHGYAVYPEPP
ncbi:hypothetical protein SAMN04244572_04846 [Azotobacter beijerinckii]|uniref:TraB family protein n=1 Tax=Azotobacter beijerinckii TaxID=170623 RepID=A0A1H7AM78_9GAMM|nr:TraB/GumN family protein [Azotobacter beijerinckii]SEJ66751.1 hypothetical protein SAMN04244572_04846 [Azotobacter beijerinckii]